MKTLIIAVAVAIVAVMAVPPLIYAHGYYVIRDRRGEMAVTNGAPVYGWQVESGPYATEDAAERATGTGTGTEWHYNAHRYFTYPTVVPRRPGQLPVEEVTP
ncbi:MAG: hypothetical protein WBG50_06800 [Desulfomonilaceae bacterium]